MLTIERQEEIMEILTQKKSATVEELSKELFVSDATIRRDLKAMEKMGLLRRSHGGAMLYKSTAEESAFAMREQEHTSEKRQIAQLALQFIKNSSCIFMDSSSTTGMIIPMLERFKYLSVITTGLRNAIMLSQTSDARIYVAGGLVQNHSNSILGIDTQEYIARVHADIALLSCTGIDLESGVTDASIEQAKVKQQMTQNAKLVLLLCDHSKFGKTFMCTDYPFSDIDYLITDRMPPAEYVEALLAAGCKIVTPDEIIE